MILFSKKSTGGGGPVKPFCSAVIAAAGSSRRMEGVDKLFAELCGVPVIARTVAAFECCDDIDEIIIVTREENIPAFASMTKDFDFRKVVKIVRGGQTRLRSVALGITEVSPCAGLIAVHDGARPLVTAEDISGVVLAAAENKASALAVPVSDTIKEVEPGGRIVRTPLRAGLRAVMTPQVFEASLLKSAYAAALESGLDVTDDCAVVEAFGAPVYVIKGSAENIKITYETDLIFAEALLSKGDDL